MTAKKPARERHKRKGNLYGTGAKGKATRLHSKIIRHGGVCAMCGSTENLQCAHIISRNYDRTRTDLRNALPLCARDHLAQSYFSPIDISLLWLDKYGKRLYKQLVKQAKEGEKKDWDKEVIFLEGVLKRLDDGEVLDFKELYR